MLPDGFADFTSLVLQKWHLDELAKSDANVWNAFLYPIFLGPTVRSAQAAYVKDVMLPFLDFENVNAILTEYYAIKSNSL
ncbi:MAG: hypothetical protein NUK63_08295 [Candidatus Bathyarchaeum tardum]|nr:MAG: hypothetical protein NUK63_08295 [Candidatus Bathyarchaeum tardum]